MRKNLVLCLVEGLLEWGFLGLFVVGFLAATVLPLGSEPIFIVFLGLGYDPAMSVVVASAGNTLGGLTTYGLGFLGKWAWIEKWLRIEPQSMGRYKRWIMRFGSPFALLCWLPLVGDLIALGLGLNRNGWLPVTIWMTIGKTARYAVIAWLL